MKFYKKDSGIGISEEKQKAIFERFVKLNSQVNTAQAGAGFGLAIPHNLIGLLGGRIWLNSAPNQGTTFYFSIQG